MTKGVCLSEPFTFQFVRCVNAEQFYFGSLISPVCKKRSAHSCFHADSCFKMQRLGRVANMASHSLGILLTELLVIEKKELQLQEFQLTV